MRTGVATLIVASTWDGASLAPTETARVELERDVGTLLVRVQGPYHGDPPPPAAPGPTDRLWEFEAVELFLAGALAPGEPVPYLEIELGPHGHHLVLRFLGVRNAVDRALPLGYRATIECDRWRGEARVPARYLPPPPWRANAFALHGVGANRRYLAAHPVPGARPDFHQPETFPAIEL